MSANEFDARQFSDRLTETLRDLGVTLGDLADVLHHSRRQVTKWTTSQNPSIPDPADLLAICRAYKISANYLLLGRGPRLLQEELQTEPLSIQLRQELTTRLLARGHDDHEVDALLTRDGDLLKRLAAIYSFRLNLAPIAVILGLTADQLEFVSTEVETRMRLSQETSIGPIISAPRLVGRKRSRKAVRTRHGKSAAKKKRGTGRRSGILAKSD